MNDSTIILIFYGMSTILCIIVGIIAIKYGYSLYSKGVGLESDGTSIQINKIKIKLQTTGSIVMFTSVVWGILAYLILPEYDNGETHIAHTKIDGESFLAETVNEDVFALYAKSIKTDSLNSIMKWGELAKNDVTEAQIMVSYGYKNGIGYSANIDSSMFWIKKALKSEFKLSEYKEADSIELAKIFKSIPMKDYVSENTSKEE